MNAVYQRNAKFVRKRSPDPDEDDSWIVVTDEESILRKIKQSLRDRDPGEGRTSRSEPRREAPPQVASRPLPQAPPAVAPRPTSRPEASSPSNADRRPPKKRRHLKSEGEIISASSSTQGDSRHSSNGPNLSTESLLQRMAHQQQSAGFPSTNNFPVAATAAADAAAGVPSHFLGALRLQQQATVGALFGNQRHGQQHHIALSPLAQLLERQSFQQATIPSNRFGHSDNQQFLPDGSSAVLGRQHHPSLPGDYISDQQQQHLLSAGQQPDYNMSTLRRLNTSSSLNATPASASSGSHRGLSSDSGLLAVHRHATGEQQQRQNQNSRQPAEEHKQLTSDELVMLQQQQRRRRRRMEHTSHEEKQQYLSTEDLLTLEILRRRRLLEAFLSQQNQGAGFGGGDPSLSSQSRNSSTQASDLLSLQILQQHRQLQGLLSGQQSGQQQHQQNFHDRHQQQNFHRQLQQQQQPPNQQLSSAEQQQACSPEVAAAAIGRAVAPRGTSADSSPEDKKPKARED